MSELRELLSYVKDYMPEVSEVKALGYIDRAYRTLLEHDTRSTVYMNSDDPEFPYPIIKKTFTYDPESAKPDEPTPRFFYLIDGQYGVFEDSQGNPITLKVNNIPISVRRVNAIFTERNRYNSGYGDSNYRPLGCYYNYGYRSSKWYDRQFVRIPCNLYPKAAEQAASVHFNTEEPYSQIDNPIYVEFWYDIPQITSKNQKLLIDIPRWRDQLINGAVGYYEDVVNGRSEKLATFKNIDLKSFKNEYNKNFENKTSQSFPNRPIG